MSTSVSEQMKAPGNTAKNVEERNIPWSQQVDEASYENLSSPGDENTYSHQSSMQFQYPPFNVKESQHVSRNNQKPRKQNSDTAKKNGKTASFNYTKRDDFQSNPWGNQKKGKNMTDNPSNINRAIRTENMYTMGKFENKAIISAPNEDKKAVTTASVAPKKTTWASIASQPAKLALRTNLSTLSHKKKGPGMPPPPMVPGKHNLDVNTWELPNNNPPPLPSPPPSTDKSFIEVDPNYTVGVGCDYEIEEKADRSHKGSQYIREDNKSNYNNSNYGRARTSPINNSRKNWSLQLLEQNNRGLGITNLGHIRRSDNNIGNCGYQSRFTERRNYTRLTEQESTLKDIGERSFESCQNVDEITPEVSNAVLEKLYDKNNYNPLEIDLNIATSARFFVIKSYSEDDIHRSIKYEIWCSTDHGNKRLDDAFKERQKEGGQVLLFFSVNGSGHFCGMAQMITAVDYNSTSSVWSQDKWKGKFKVKWIYVKDVPNLKLRHIRLENNDNKSVTNSRDTQEVPNAKGIEVLQILHCYKHSTSIFDDFYHYEKKQEEEVSKKPTSYDNVTTTPPISRHYSRQSDDRDRERDIRVTGGCQKFFSSGTASFRERNNSYRGSFHNFNEQRRNESHKMNLSSDSQQKERDDRADTEVDRDNNEYGCRYGSKLDYIQRSKHNKERDLNEKETRYRSSAKETLKDNEYGY